MRTTMLGGLLGCLIGAAPLQAASYPERPITIIVPFGKGTTADLIAAAVAEAMSKNIGQKVMVERPQVFQTFDTKFGRLSYDLSQYHGVNK